MARRKIPITSNKPAPLKCMILNINPKNKIASEILYNFFNAILFRFPLMKMLSEISSSSNFSGMNKLRM